MVTLSIVVNLLGLNGFITKQGLNLPALLGFAAVFGFGGLYFPADPVQMDGQNVSRGEVIDVPRSRDEIWLMATVRRQAEKADIGMPEVAIYDSPEVNAFATGANRNNALVAVSTGLLNGMTQDEAEAVLAHEVSTILLMATWSPWPWFKASWTRL